MLNNIMFLKIISVFAAVMLISIGSAEKTVVIDLQANPEILSDINQKSSIKILFNFSENIKSISTARIIFQVPTQLSLKIDDIVFNNLNKIDIFEDINTKEYKLFFSSNDIVQSNEYSIEFPLSCYNFGDYSIKINSAKFNDDVGDEIQVQLNDNLLVLEWNAISCSEEDCEDQNGPFESPYNIDNLIYQKIKFDCHCESGRCDCDEDKEISDISDLCKYISISKSDLSYRENLTIKADFTELADEVAISNISLSYLTDKNIIHTNTWNYTNFIEQKINNLSEGEQNINIKAYMDFYEKEDVEKICPKYVKVNPMPGIDVYFYILPSLIDIGKTINAEVLCINKNSHPIKNITLSFELRGPVDKILNINFKEIFSNENEIQKLNFTMFSKGNFFIKEYNYTYNCFGELFHGTEYIKNEVNFEIFEPPTLLDIIWDNIKSFIFGLIVGIIANAIYGLLRDILK